MDLRITPNHITKLKDNEIFTFGSNRQGRHMTKEYLEALIDEEGDSMFWKYTCKNGLLVDCSIKRNSMLGLCGYITITPDSELYDVNYNEIDTKVHGGLTYSDYDENKNWVIGFDCGHNNDLLPCLLLNGNYINDNYNDGYYRDMKYVKEQCESIAEQTSKFNKIGLRNEKIKDLLNK